ncbi:MAG TPA: hypothetical protein VFC24_09785 [Casimicrobiaceae bacterium]|nr:hypothetical protein [Casimicrobiaceae bacterium]
MSASHDTIRELARSLGCMLEDELCALAQIEGTTAAAWRKRGTGPSYIRIGNRYLYPLTAVQEHMKALVRERRAVPAKALL